MPVLRLINCPMQLHVMPAGAYSQDSRPDSAAACLIPDTPASCAESRVLCMMTKDLACAGAGD